MPIPFILGAIAAGTAAVGIGKGIKAGIDQSDANSTNESAEYIAKKAADEANVCRKNSGDAINALGQTKLSVLNGSVKSFVDVFEKIHNIELTNSVGLDELQKFKLDKQSFSELKKIQTVAASIAGGIAGGAAAGAVTAFGACSAAVTFGAASTGTAIATLSGAAATNATLAFLGGGSLAAGGLGVAGGAAILGGLAAGPALAVMGFIVGAKASENKDNAYANLAKSKEFREEMGVVKAQCKAIRMRAAMFERLLLKLNAIFEPLIYALENIVRTSGTDYSRYSRKDRAVVAASMSVAGAIKKILDTPLLTEDGKLTDASEKVVPNIQNLIEDKNVRLLEVR